MVPLFKKLLDGSECPAEGFVQRLCRRSSSEQQELKLNNELMMTAPYEITSSFLLAMTYLTISPFAQ